MKFTKDAMNSKIMELFMKLIQQPPAMIEDKNLYYNLDGVVIDITWFTKREKDSKTSSYYLLDNPPFNNCSDRSNWGFPTNWVVCTSPELEGYTFYINTPAGQFKVPELSRRELVDVQELIEKHYLVFADIYLDKLLKADNYGTVVKKGGFRNWVANDVLINKEYIKNNERNL